MKTIFVRVLSVLVLVITLILCLLAVRSMYRSVQQHRFESVVREYNRESERDAAWLGFSLAKSKLTDWEVEVYKKRLDGLEMKYQHRFQSAIVFAFDPTPIMDREIDSFDSVLTDISFRLGREESPGKEVWELCESQGRISSVNWPFVCQGFKNHNGTISKVSYEEYLDLKNQFGPAKEHMEILLAKYEKK